MYDRRSHRARPPKRKGPGPVNYLTTIEKPVCDDEHCGHPAVYALKRKCVEGGVPWEDAEVLGHYCGKHARAALEKANKRYEQPGLPNVEGEDGAR